MGAQFGQHVEPRGMYVTLGHNGQEGEHEEPSWDGKPFIVKTIHGTTKINNPLVVHHGGYGEGGWKQRLSELYDGKVGEELSSALVEDGYDGIITVYSGSVSEILLLRTAK